MLRWASAPPGGGWRSAGRSLQLVLELREHDELVLFLKGGQTSRTRHARAKKT